MGPNNEGTRHEGWNTEGQNWNRTDWQDKTPREWMSGARLRDRMGHRQDRTLRDRMLEATLRDTMGHWVTGCWGQDGTRYHDRTLRDRMLGTGHRDQTENWGTGWETDGPGRILKEMDGRLRDRTGHADVKCPLTPKHKHMVWDQHFDQGFHLLSTLLYPQPLRHPSHHHPSCSSLSFSVQNCIHGISNSEASCAFVMAWRVQIPCYFLPEFDTAPPVKNFMWMGKEKRV